LLIKPRLPPLEALIRNDAEYMTGLMEARCV